jgi:hypothetical protein
MPHYTCEHANDHPHAADRLDEIETLADALEDALYNAINAYTANRVKIFVTSVRK